MMNSSTWLPWLFFGPLLGCVGSYILYTLTGWPAARVTAQVLVVVIVVFIATAFVANWRRSKR